MKMILAVIIRIFGGALFATFLASAVNNTSADEHTHVAYDNCSNIANAYKKEGFYDSPQLEGVVLLRESLESIFLQQTQNKSSLPVDIAGRRYNWWQVLLDNGGRPGTLKSFENSNSPSAIVDPCKRTLLYNFTDFINDAYHYEDSDFKEVYRDETARQAFQGTPKQFLYAIGQLVWTPPTEAKDTTVYRVVYILNDIGFWVRILPDKCRFTTEDGKPALYCIPDTLQNPFGGAKPNNLLAHIGLSFDN